MRWIISLLFMLMGPVTALAQQQAPPPAGNFWYDNTASPPLWRPASTAYPFPISGSFTANLNGFAPSLSYATCSSTGSSCASTAIPTNTGSVVLFNSGTTAVSCTVASGAATALTNEIQIPASSGIALATVYGATTYDHFACIDQTGSATNVVVASGGSGLPTGWGGGGAGGSSTITNWGSGSNTLGAMANYGTSPGAVLVPGVNAYVTGSTPEGGIADAAYNGTGSASLISINKGLYNVLTSPLPQGNNLIGYTTSDPCSYGTKITINIGQTATSKIISGSPGKKTYICTGAGFTSAAAVYGIEEGTGSVCGTGTHDVAGMNGSNNGTPFMSLAANGGLTFGAGSGSHIVVGNAAGDDVCIVQSGTANFSGWVSVVQQ